MQGGSGRESELQRLTRRFQDLRSEPLTTLVRRGVDKLFVYGYTPIAHRLRSTRGFTFLGEQYSYFTHQYNATWRNERSVEIALALRFLERMRGRRLLEVGNVMNYYSDSTHDVVDLYENSPGPMKVDFLDFEATDPYQCFLSISTFEHIGWDEQPRNPAKVTAALSRVSAVVRNATPEDVLITFPLGYNTQLDELVSTSRLKFPRQGALVRVNDANDWCECDIKDALGRPYGKRYRAANALFVGFGAPTVV